MTSSPWSSLPVDPKSTARLEGFLYVCRSFNVRTCFSLSGGVKHWAPCFASCLLSFVFWFLPGELYCRVSESWTQGGESCGICRGSSVRREAGEPEFPETFRFHQTPWFWTFSQVELWLGTVTDCRVGLRPSCLRGQTHDAWVLLRLLACCSHAICTVAAPYF